MSFVSADLTLVPYLDKLSSESWTRFVADHEAYQARGGVKELKALVSPSVMTMLAVRVPALKDLTSPNFLTRVSALFAPTSKLESYDRFQRLRMLFRGGSQLTVDNVYLFIQAFDREELLCASVLPEDKRLRKLFIKGLKPERLGHRVEFRDPKTLAEAKVFAVEETEALIRMFQEVSFLDPTAAPLPAPRKPPEGSSRPPGFSGTVRPPLPNPQAARGDTPPILVCHGCGHNGHTRPNCPHKDQPGWFREGRRLQRLPLPAQVKAVHTAEGQVPRLNVHLRSSSGKLLPVTALLDSGSSVNLLSPQVFEQLLKHGVDIRRLSTPTLLSGVGGAQLELDTEVTLTLIANPQLEVSAKYGVADTGEQVILGYPFMQSTGILSLLDPVEVPAESVLDADDEVPQSFADPDSAFPMIGPTRLRPQLEELVSEYEDLFQDKLSPEGAAVEPMSLELKPGESPTPIPPRRISPATREAINVEVQALLAAGIVRPSSSPYSSPIVVVKKSDGTPRMCIDYRLVNGCTRDMKFPLQNSKAVLERMAGSKWFATLDLRSGFHQVLLDPKAIPLSAFATPDGLFEFTRVPFGLKNAPAHFQRVMAQVLSGLPGCEVFIDDIIVYSGDEVDFLHRLRRVFDRLRQARLTLKGSKCKLGLPQVEYLGHIVDGNGISLSQARKQAIMDIREPTSTATARSFMGIANYFRSFIPNFAGRVKPLTALCSEKTPFEWTPGSQEAFNLIKDAIAQAPLLHHLDYSKEIYLRTDASQVGLGAMLYQKLEGRDCPVSFVSKAFTPTEKRWSTIEQEAFAAYYAVISFTHFLLGHHFYLETDHRNLVYLYRASAPKLIRWRLRLQEFDYTVVHIPGTDNVVADALSRCFVLTATEGLISAAHNSTIGHGGIKLTIDRLKAQDHTWDTMKQDVEAYIRSCPVCQKCRLGQGSMAAAQHSTSASQPFEVVAFDTMGPFPEDVFGNRYIIAAIDCFSRFIELRATPGVSALDAARVLLDIFGRYGAPKSVRTDQGTQYTSRVISNFLSLCGSERQLTLAYRPQANGIVERANAEIGRHLRALVMDHRLRDSWSQALPLVQRILNATPHSALGTAPSRILFGQYVSLDRGILDTQAPIQEEGRMVGVEDYVQQLKEQQETILRLSQEYLQSVIDERLTHNPAQPTSFEQGDYVLVSYPSRPPSKLTPQWRGPLVVTDVKGSTYSCQDLCTLKVSQFHLERLKLYTMDRTSDPVAIAAADADEWEVEAIVDHRLVKGSSKGRKAKGAFEFLVRWKGFEPSDDSWLPYSSVSELSALDTYASTHPELRL